VAFGTVSDDGEEGEWNTHGDLEKLKVRELGECVKCFETMMLNIRLRRNSPIMIQKL
jgi:hypothetical protein